MNNSLCLGTWRTRPFPPAGLLCFHGMHKSGDCDSFCVNHGGIMGYPLPLPRSLSPTGHDEQSCPGLSQASRPFLFMFRSPIHSPTYVLGTIHPLLPPLPSLPLQVDINMVLAVRETLMQATSAGGRLSQPLGRLDARRAIGAASGGDAEVNEALERLLGAGEQKQVRSC